jgi:peptidyl-prolyl cis-trans isomerase C
MLFFDSGEANQAYNRLQAGEKFETILTEYETLLTSDLGWFPKGYILDPELDKAIFEDQGLQAGEYSKVVETRLGYHIIQVVERDPQHPLDPDVLLKLQSKAVQDWLKERHAKGNIQTTLP